MQGMSNNASAGLFTTGFLTASKLACVFEVDVKVFLSLAPACIGATTIAKFGKNMEYYDTKPRRDLKVASS